MPIFRSPNNAGSSGITPRGIHPTAHIGENFRQIDSSVGPDCIVDDSVSLKYVDVGAASTIGYHSIKTFGGSQFQAVANLDGRKIIGKPYDLNEFPIEAIRTVLEDYGIIFNPNTIDTTATHTPPGGPALGHGQ